MSGTSDDSRRSGGTGFLTLLTVMFIGLRLAGAIDWPWWLVLAPLWGGALLRAAAVFFWLLVYFWADQHIDR